MGEAFEAASKNVQATIVLLVCILGLGTMFGIVWLCAWLLGPGVSLLLLAAAFFWIIIRYGMMEDQ